MVQLRWWHREVHSNGRVWDDQYLEDPEITDAIANSGSVQRECFITNVEVTSDIRRSPECLTGVDIMGDRPSHLFALQSGG